MADETTNQQEKMIDFKNRAEECEREIVELEKKYRLMIGATLDFKIYKKLPAEVELALVVINNHDGVFVRKFIDRPEVKDAN